MNNEERLKEVMSELLAEVHDMRIEIKGMRTDIQEVKGEQTKTNASINELKGEQAKTNLSIQELRLSVMRLADFGDRILTLEKEVFKKAS